MPVTRGFTALSLAGFPSQLLFPLDDLDVQLLSVLLDRILHTKDKTRSQLGRACMHD